MTGMTEDAVEFGDVFVYCSQHMRPHRTGWCTVCTRHKVKLDATDYEPAILECRAKGFKLFGELENE